MKKAILLLFVFLVFISLANAAALVEPAKGCCEKTTSGEWCMFTDAGSCAAESKFLPATCEQTSYCTLGCCYSSDEGRCFKNTPRATCTAEGATWTKDPACEISQCDKGCCVLGDQAFFVTEVKCKQVASEFSELEMVYKPEIISEFECIASAKSSEVGCCVQENSCTFAIRANCPISEIAIEGNKTTGFYNDMLCSNDKLQCGCAKQQTTGCVGEDVYWFDSCGNRENIYDRNKDKSYNRGFVLTEGESCKASGPEDISCGNCEYLEGMVCGDDDNQKMPIGKFTCIDLDCGETFEDDTGISPNADGRAKNNGESWCVFDGAPGLGRDLVGSRHYRHLCINGEEVVETCKDFREEICIQGVVGQDALDNFEAMRGLFGEGEYIEAACRDNRNENCFACNNVLSEELEELGKLTETIIEKRKECCLNEDVRDCYWQPSVLKGEKEGLDGTCVPQVPLGLKFWGDTPKSQVAADDKAKKDNAAKTPSGKAEQACNLGDHECKVVYQRPGLARLGTFGHVVRWAFLIRVSDDAEDKWRAIVNGDCVAKEWVVAGNSICKSLGDCGAYFNIRGELTKDGYYNSLIDEDRFNVDGKKFRLKDADIGDVEALVEGVGWNKEDSPGFLEQGGTNMLFSAGATMVVSGLWAGFAGSESFWDGLVAGATPFGGIGEAFDKKAKFGQMFTTQASATLSDEAKTKIAEGLTKDAINKRAGEIIAKDIQAGTIGSDKIMAVQAQEMAKEQLTEETVKAKAAEAAEAQTSAAGGAMSVLQTYMWMRSAVQLIDIIATETKDVTYTIDCALWQQPSGGDDCESCNEEMKPCSEYKCMSLGAACKLVNKGSSDEKCVAVDTNDVTAPLIKPYHEVLTPPYTLQEVEEAGHPGYKLNENVPPFTPITLGIDLDEPATCKYDVSPGTTFDKMPATFGSIQLLYKQEVMFSLPSELAQPNVTAHNKGEYAMFIRCKDANGNTNKRDYFIKFNVDDSPDLTPPSIRFTSLENEGYITADTEQMALSIYVDEYAECSWSRRDTEFELMENKMSCSQDSFGQSSLYFGTYECKTTLTNLTNSKNVFFIRCKDKPYMEEKERNVMSESFKFTLLGTIPLEITDKGPEGLQFTNDITMFVTTSKGAEAGVASCAFSQNDVQFAEMIIFEATDVARHSQDFQNMATGSYNFHVSCMDAAGNEARDRIIFEVAVDTDAPQLNVVYTDSMFGLVHLEFDEECSCEYSSRPTFVMGEGTPTGTNTTIHEMSLTQDIYYVKCVDKFTNQGSYTIYTEI